MGINGRQQEQVKEDVPKDRQEEGKCVLGMLTTKDGHTLPSVNLFCVGFQFCWDSLFLFC